MNPENPASDKDGARDDIDNSDDSDSVDVAPVPRPRPGYQTKPSLSATMARFAPVAAGVIRAVAGVLAFSAALLTLPIHFATPFLSGVGLLMLVGGCLSVVKECRDEPRLRWFSRLFPLACSIIVVVVGVIVAIYGAGVFAPDLRREPPPARDDGAIRFEP